MMARLNTLLLLCVACLLLTADVLAQQILDASELAGSYAAGHNFGGSSITLKADGSYSESSGSCTFTTEESGVYVFSAGALRFTILKYTGKQNGHEQEIDLFDPQARKEFFGYRDDEKVGPLKTEFTLLPVRWGERIYLIYETDLDDFANAINLGLEPRTALGSEPYYGPFFLREGDERKSVSGKPALPGAWRPFLLSKPVTARIVAVEERGEDTIATINRGRRHGLKVGMKLAVKEHTPTPWSNQGLVVSVGRKTAKVQIYDLKVGGTLSTRYVPGETYR